ncbi:MAG TPA: peptidoglycan-binding protein [Streptosporangiaceae bacterium]|nr:peptidoglycan-binding protein [Streptosporangiaceae bacterium]
MDTAAVDTTAVDGARGYDRLRRRRIILLGAVALVVIAGASALLLTSQIKSPAEQAAQTRPPALTDLTAPVQNTVLTTTVLGEAVVHPPKEFSPSAIGSSGGSAGASNQNVQPIVTRILRHGGSTVGQGSVLLEVAGQPFFVLQGSVPAYRNLEPGETGLDVTQLQEDLQSLGYSTGADASGSFGSGTSAAVGAFYKGIGYTPQRITSGPKADRGPVVPLGQYTFVPRLPARIAKLSATVGQSISASALTLAIGNPTISGQLNPSEATVVRPGMPVTIAEPGSGLTMPGRITSVSHVTASKASVSGGLYVRVGIRPDRPLPMSLVGQDLSLTIAAARSHGAVLAVPEAAVFASADGRTYVSKLVGTTAVRVAVQVGMSGGGLLQVTPLQPGALTTGDRVITGENYSTAGGAHTASGASRLGQ